MSRTPPDILAMLRDGGILPVFWRRKRPTARWHRGMRLGTTVARSQCGRVAGAGRAQLLYAPIEEPWPEPHCAACETATPGTDAVREYLDEGKA